MSTSASYIPLVNDIRVVIVSVWFLNSCGLDIGQTKRTQEKSKELYECIIDNLSRKDDKNEQTVRDFYSFIKKNRHLFGPEFKEILPQSFDAFWGSQIILGTIDMTFYSTFFRNLKGYKPRKTINPRREVKTATKNHTVIDLNLESGLLFSLLAKLATGADFVA